MAEALVAFGVAASIAQFASMAIDLSRQIHDFINSVDEAPSVLRDITIQLPLLAKICQTFEFDDSEPESESLSLVLTGCLDHIQEFSGLTRKLSPTASDSKLKRAWKATTHALHYEKKFSAFQKTLESFKSTLELYCSHEDRMLRRRPSVNAPIVILPPLSPSVVRYTLRRLINQRFNEFAESYPGARVVVLHGMGGQGKTRLALDFAHEAVGGCSFSHIIWMDATSKKTLARSYEDVADRLANSKTAFTDAESRIKFVKDKLSGNPWLLIFDNLDHPQELGPIHEFLPPGNGSIVITSRHRDTLRYGKHVSLSQMDESEALELLLRGTRHKLGFPGVREEALKIIQKLGNLPLAIDQASAYIQTQELPLELFLKHYEQMKKKVLSQKHVDWTYVKKLDGDKNSGTSFGVLTTWEMSFQQIDNNGNRRETVEHLLTLAAFLGNADVRERLFEVYHAHSASPNVWYRPFIKGQRWDSAVFREAIAELSRLSLVESRSTKHRECCLALHPMIRDWLQLRISQPLRARFVHEATLIVANFIDKSSSDGVHAIYRDLLEHQDACCAHDLTEHQNPGKIGFGDLRDAALTFTTFYALHGRCREAVRPMENVLENDRKEWGLDHPTTLVSLRKLADVYAQNGRYPDAQNLLTSAVALFTTSSKGPDIEVLRLSASLGDIHKYQDQLEEAERFYETALQGFESNYSAYQTDMLLCIENLAEVKRYLNKIPESASLYARVKLVHEERGANHSGDSPDMLRVLGRLADLYRSQGHYGPAEEVYSRVYNGYMLQFGADHPSTSVIRVNLAIACRNQGKFIEAERYFEQAIVSLSRIRGPDHLDTLRAIMNKAKCVEKQGHYGAAEVMYRVVLTGRKLKLGYVHYTLNAADRLAWMLWKQDKREAAEALAVEIMVMAEKATEEDLKAARTIVPYPALETLFRESTARNSKKYTPDHVDVLEASESLSEVLIAHGKYKEGHELREKIAKAEAKEKLKREQARGAGPNVSTLFSLSNSMLSQQPSREVVRESEQVQLVMAMELPNLTPTLSSAPSLVDYMSMEYRGESRDQPPPAYDQLELRTTGDQNPTAAGKVPTQALRVIVQQLGLDKPAGLLLVILLMVSMGWQCLHFLQRTRSGSLSGGEIPNSGAAEL